MNGRVLLLVLAGGVGCNQYIYQPEENATAQMRGQTAADYQVPPDHPEGSVRVASFGVVKLKPDKSRALNVRMVVENNSLDRAWIVDGHQLQIEMRNQGRVAPSIVSSDSGEGPIVQVPPHGKRVIDLFYPLPEGADKAGKIPAFDFIWQVQTPTRTVAERTPFERISVVNYGYPYWYGYNWYWPPIALGYPGWYF